MIKRMFILLLLSLLMSSNSIADSLLTGQGYDASRDKGMGHCLTGTTAYSGGSGGELTIDSNISYSELYEKMYIKMDNEYKTEAYGDYSGKREFLREVTTSSLSHSFLYSSRFFLQDKIFVESGYNSIGETALASGSGNIFREACGTGFLKSVSLGGGLYISIKFIFLSEDDYQAFTSEFSGNWGMSSLTVNMESVVQDKNLNGRVKIRAYQDGGNPAALGMILGSSGDYECSLEDLSACRIKLEEIKNYAVNFAEQFIGDPGSSTIGPAELGYTYQDYSVLAQPIPPMGDIVDVETQAARDHIFSLLEASNHQLNIASELLSVFGNVFTDEKSSDLNGIQDSLIINIDNIKLTGLNCWHYPDTCLSNYNLMLTSLLPIDTSLLIAPEVPYELRSRVAYANTSGVKNVNGSWFGWDNQGGGIAVHDLNSNGLPEVITLGIDNPSGENFMYYRVGWDVDYQGNVTNGWSEHENIPGYIGWEHQGAGITVGNLDGNPNPEILVYYNDNPSGANKRFYKIGWNITFSGDITAWSDPIEIPGYSGWDNQGGGIAIGNIDSDSRPDLVTYYIDNPSGENTAYYSIGWNINSYGHSTGGWSSHKPIPGYIGWENQGGSIAIADMTNTGTLDIVELHIDNPSGENSAYYRIGFKLNQDGNVEGGWTDPILIPGNIGWESQGAGLAVHDIDHSGFQDIIMFYIDNLAGANGEFYKMIPR